VFNIIVVIFRLGAKQQHHNTIEEFNVDSEADCDQLNLAHIVIILC